MTLFNRITLAIRKHSLIASGDTVIIGLSGGPDSVLLTHYLHAHRNELNCSLVIAHLNHGWRAEADGEAEQCRMLGMTLNIPTIIGHARDYKHLFAANGSKEAHGRLMRRHFFEEVASRYPQAKIALAHHQDDQEETFFIRLIRGATVQGLKGMLPRHGIYIRPLLSVRKADILEYLHTQNIPYAIDCSNQDDTYLRNRIRNHVLPELRAADNRTDRALIQTMDHLAEVDQFITESATAAYTRMIKNEQDALWIDTRKLQTEPLFLQHHVIMLWLKQSHVAFTPSTAFMHEIMRFLHSNRGGTHRLGPSWALKKERGWATIVSLPLST